jgi:hypothetical protein
VCSKTFQNLSRRSPHPLAHEPLRGLETPWGRAVKGDVQAARELRGWLQVYPPEEPGDIEIGEISRGLRNQLLQRLIHDTETRVAGGQCPACGRDVSLEESEPESRCTS